MPNATGGHLEDAIWQLDAQSVELWIFAITFFVVGDVATTLIGLTGGHLIEVGPLAAPVIHRFGLSALVGLKLGALGVCLVLWRCSSRPSAVGVPLGLATFGILVTAWNGALLLGVP